MFQLAATVGPALIALGLLYLARGFFMEARESLRTGRTPAVEAQARTRWSRGWRARPSVSRQSQPGLFWTFVIYSVLFAAFLLFLALCALMILTATLLTGTSWMTA